MGSSKTGPNWFRMVKGASRSGPDLRQVAGYRGIGVLYVACATLATMAVGLASIDAGRDKPGGYRRSRDQADRTWNELVAEPVEIGKNLRCGL